MGRAEVQSKALDIALTNHRCGLGISMGVGKTRIALQHMIKNFNQFSTFLVVAPKKSIFKAWQEECEKLNCNHILDHVTFTTYLSLNKQDPKGYDIVYLDECHSLLFSHKDFLDNYQGKILGLTGTPPVYGEKAQLVSEFCPIKYSFGVDDATDNNILNDYRIIVHMLPLSGLRNIPKKKHDGGVWYNSELKEYQYVTARIDDAKPGKAKQLASIMRMKSMMDYPTKESYAKSLMKMIDDKCIVFANTQKQADRMSQYSYHSKNPMSEENLQLFSDGHIDKMSCVLQLNEGANIPGLKAGIIMHAYGNERKSAQRIGRLLRLNPDDMAVCHILCYQHTIDEVWVSKSLSSFHQDKIKYYYPNKKSKL